MSHWFSSACIVLAVHAGSHYENSMSSMAVALRDITRLVNEEVHFQPVGDIFSCSISNLTFISIVSLIQVPQVCASLRKPFR